MANFEDEKMTMMTTIYKDKASKKLQDRVVSKRWPLEVSHLFIDLHYYCAGKHDCANQKRRASQVNRYSQSQLS